MTDLSALLRPGQFVTDELLILLWFDPFAIYGAWQESPVNLRAFTSDLENPSVSSVVGRHSPIQGSALTFRQLSSAVGTLIVPIGF